MYNFKNFVILKRNFLEGGGEGVVDGLILKIFVVVILFFGIVG